MRFPVKHSLAPVALLAISACMMPPKQYEVTRQMGLPGASLDATWNAVVELFGERTWTIANMEKASGFINSDWMISDRTPQYLDCGSPGGLNTDFNKRGRFNVVVRQPSPTAEVVVTVNTTWQAMRRVAASSDKIGNPIECVSTGVLENEVHRELRDRLSARPTGTP